MTKPLEHYLENADELAQQVVNATAPTINAGHLDGLAPKIKALLDKACRYRNAKRAADNHREFNRITIEDNTEETDSRLAFAEAYKALEDSVEGIELLSRRAHG